MKRFLKIFLFTFMIFSFSKNLYAEEISTSTLSDDIIISTLTDDIILDETTPSTPSDDDLTNETPVASSSDDIQIQTAKIIISKTDEDGVLLSGSRLQIVDTLGNIIEEWISDGTKKEIFLPDGKYILREISAPVGYELAEDQEFEVNIQIYDINADVDWKDWPCNHSGGVPLYYVEVNSVSYEVYCMNQGWEAPDGVEYDGEIISENEIRDFTVQTISTSGEEYFGTGKYGKAFYKKEVIITTDVSDQTLSDKELYDKILNIIYNRNKVYKYDKFKNLKEAEIRFITEYALKNYLNAGITSILESARDENDNNVRFEAEDGKKYLKFEYKYYNREYVYDPTTTKGYRVSRGNGNSLGNLARHWYTKHGRVHLPEIYAELFNYLIDDETQHPEDMKLYVYSTNAIKDGVPYQHLLGITGYLDDNEEQTQEIVMVDNYSEETTSIKVEKTWDDNNNQDGIRPNKVEVILYADNQEYNKIILNENNNWNYTFNNLPVFNKGKKIEYTISETQIEGYETIINNFNITNYHEPEKREIQVIKIWDDKDNYNKLRPISVIVNLYKDGEFYETIELNKENNWKHTFKDLDKYYNGKEIIYTITEEKVANYDAEIDGNMNDGFTITNIHYGEGGEENPKTFDNIYTTILLFITSLLSLVSLYYLNKRLN